MARDVAESPTMPVATVFDLWLQDGNLVLSAVNAAKTSTILFRIHMSSLAGRSEVFDSMLGIPQGENSEQMEVYEGSPLVRLMDSAEDVEALLRAIYDPYPVFQRLNRSDTPLRIRQALIMASKYLMDGLRERLISIIEQEWPLRLRDMERRDAIIDDDIAKFGVYSTIEWPDYLIPEPAAAIALAEHPECHIPSILPAAYYNLLRCEPTKSWEAALKKICSSDDARFIITRDGGKPARWECLSATSFFKLLRVQSFVENALRKHFSYTFLEEIQGCRSRSRSCYTTWIRILDRSRYRVSFHIHRLDIFGQLRDLDRRMTKAYMCYNCHPKYSDRIAMVKTGVWEGLEGICCPRLG
ncbi:hypothetical protein SCHPADRAFT_873850 [Schizopora paradoxa]|uniref:BTB domain-containing protein n=1 Tax=Schizopora paradoxa TaxID=27342 RepID=A0A0H2RVX6_9AGAM|nr:hypothetical protein SCHPADRAFT_873850 [Schizopora paradoxa]